MSVEEGNNILVSHKDWGFAITEQSIADGLHVSIAKETFPKLIETVKQARELELLGFEVETY